MATETRPCGRGTQCSGTAAIAQALENGRASYECRRCGVRTIDYTQATREYAAARGIPVPVAARELTKMRREMAREMGL